MESFRAIILGIIQGLTEFLPVSSSGHLELAKFILNDPNLAHQSLLWTVALHAATALSTIVVFRKDIRSLVYGLFSKQDQRAKRFFWCIVVSMIPAALAGFLMESQISVLFDQQITLVGCMLFITGLLLFLADRATNTDKHVSGVSALIIGISQAISILPGISRSGATISTAVLLGIDRDEAARFSFLMVVPLILGKMAYDLLFGLEAYTSVNPVHLTLGFLAAFATGMLACKWMIALVKRSKLTYFSLYCFAVGTAAIVLSLLWT